MGSVTGSKGTVIKKVAGTHEKGVEERINKSKAHKKYSETHFFVCLFQNTKIREPFTLK